MTLSEYNSCVDEYADGAYRFVLKNLKDSESAQDIIQDTFEKLWIKVEEVSREKAKSYIYTTAYHTMIDKIRRDKKKADFNFVDETKLLVRNSYSDLKHVLDNALSKLPEIQKAVILLRDYEGYNYKEIGEITGLNESQVKVYIYRARLSLKEMIGSPENVL